VISSCYQAAWEKLFRYMDIEPRLVQPSAQTFTIDPEHVRDKIDEHTIGVVCIMGNHYGGQYDPVWAVDEVVQEVNAAKDLQVGIHVDAASGGFIAPFQPDLPAWDFRLPSVLSISASGHKYGESCCGTGWVVWRKREGLSEHVAISVTYLGGKADSYTLNFSRPASGVYVQFYKLLRHGLSGFRQCCENMMQNAKFIRDGLKAMTHQGLPRFILLDAGDDGCLPVVTARLNPACELSYDDIDLQHVLAQHHWYVGGYKMGFQHPLTEELEPLFTDAPADTTLFRVVVKNNLTRDMAEHLLASFEASFEFLNEVDFSGPNSPDLAKLRHKDHRRMTNHC
jgi:glutamate decarboxylase